MVISRKDDESMIIANDGDDVGRLQKEKQKKGTNQQKTIDSEVIGPYYITYQKMLKKR